MWPSSQIGLGDETYITNTLVPNDDPLCVVPPHSPTCVMSTKKQDDCLLRENWYMFLQERLELEKGMLDSPPGFCVVYETDTSGTDEHDASRYVFLYLGETSIYYSLCKRAREWKELWADWLFHRGNRPEIAVSYTLSYETLLDELRCNIRDFSWPIDNKANGTFKNIFATGVFKTLQIFKSHIQSMESDVLATPLLRAEVVKCATSFFNKIHWQETRDVLVAKREQLNAAHEKRKKIDPTQTTTLSICVREIEAYTLECQHLTRICVYKVGQLHGIVNVASFYENPVLSTLTNTGYTEAVHIMLNDDANHLSTLSHTFTHSMPISKEEQTLKTQHQINLELRNNTSLEYANRLYLKHYIQQFEKNVIDTKIHLKIKKLTDKHIAWNNRTLKTVESLCLESDDSTCCVPDTAKLRAFITNLRQELVVQWELTRQKTLKYHQSVENYRKYTNECIDVQSHKSDTAHIAPDDDIIMHKINKLHDDDISFTQKLNSIKTGMENAATLVLYHEEHASLMSNTAKNAHELFEKTWQEQLKIREQTVKAAQQRVQDTNAVLAKFKAHAQIRTARGSASPGRTDSHYAQVKITGQATSQRDAGNNSSPSSDSAIDSDLQAPHDNEIVGQATSQRLAVENSTSSNDLMSHEAFCLAHHTNMPKDHLALTDLTIADEDVLSLQRIVREKQVLSTRAASSGGQCQDVASSIINEILNNIKEDSKRISTHDANHPVVLSTDFGDVFLEKLKRIISELDLWRASSAELRKFRSDCAETYSNESTEHNNAHTQPRSEDKLPNIAVAPHSIRASHDADKWEIHPTENGLVHFPHESALASRTSTPIPRRTNDPGLYPPDTHVPTPSPATLPIHNEMQLAIASGPLDTSNVVGIGAFIIINSHHVMHEMTGISASVLAALVYNENDQTHPVLQSLFSCLQNQQTGYFNAVPLQIGNGSSGGLSQNDFNIGPLIAFFSQNSTCNTTKLLSQLIKLCEHENSKNVQNLSRLFRELQHGAAHVSRHVCNARSFLAKHALDVGCSVNEFSVLGLNAAVIASGMMSQCAAHNATRFMQIVNPRLDHVIADTPTASAVPLSEGAATSASMGQSLPNPRTHKSSRLDADVSHESDILSPNEEFRNDSEPLMVSTLEDDALIFQEINTAISNINESLAAHWLCATGVQGDNCGELFVHDVVAYFTQKLNAVSDNARKIQLLKQMINGPLSISMNAQRFNDNSSSQGLLNTLHRALSRVQHLLADVCRVKIKVENMPITAQRLHRDGRTSSTNIPTLQALHWFFHDLFVAQSPPYRNTRSKRI